jgi:quinol monooxygenase YgiN
MSCTVIFEMKEKPGQRGDLQALLQEFLPVTRERDGCISIEAFGNSDENGILCVEHWQSRPQYDAYLAWRVERGDIGRVVQLCAEQPSVRFFEAVSA